MAIRLHIFSLAWLFASALHAAEPIPKPIIKIIDRYCIDCHDAETEKGDLNLEATTIDWGAVGSLHRWEDVLKLVGRQIMPPMDKKQPSAEERKVLMTWLDQSLVTHSKAGGAPLRRLNRREYLNTIRTVFLLEDFELPVSFPADNTLHGFDTQGEALVISPSHLEAYTDTATAVADLFFPPPKIPVKPRIINVPASDLAISYSSAALIDGAMRLASGGKNVIRNATWPTKFEAPASGTYRLRVTASFKDAQPPLVETPPLLVMEAVTAEGKGSARKLAELEITKERPTEFDCEVALRTGETVAFRYANAPFDYENKAAFPGMLNALFTREPRLAAAWKKERRVPRGGVGWLRLKKYMADPELKAIVKPEEIQGIARRASGNSVSTGETLVYKFFEDGPYLGIHHLRVDGPYDVQEDPKVGNQYKRTQAFVGAILDQDDEATLRSWFERFLPALYRRPVRDVEVSELMRLVQGEVSRGRTRSEGMHLALRTALVSPSFIYRETDTGELGNYELANRLSYFLTSHPPDSMLLAAAASGDIGDSKVLRAHTTRLLKQNTHRFFVKDFTSQWLHTHVAESLMPDPRLMPAFSEQHRKTMLLEVERTFAHILAKNLPLTDFIAPDYVFTDPLVGRDIYNIPQFTGSKKKKVKKGMQLVSVDAGGRHGGLLSMSAVMMATANGVDTQPVLRGVWMLENILGMPPPDPPNAVPALTPDTTGARSPRERLAAHMADPACAACHKDIDPLGFVLENFDPIGRWREHYPVYSKNEKGNSVTSNGLKVDVAGTLPNGVPLADITDLKKYLASNPGAFSSCLAEKLLMYAVGRPLNYAERKQLKRYIHKQDPAEFGLQDLIVGVVDSALFRRR